MSFIVSSAEEPAALIPTITFASNAEELYETVDISSNVVSSNGEEGTDKGA